MPNPYGMVELATNKVIITVTAESAKKYLTDENELRRVLSNTQKAGNLKAYNAIEAELNHTIGKNGHCYTAFAQP